MPYSSSSSFVSTLTSALPFAADSRVLRPRAGDFDLHGDLRHERLLREGHLRWSPRAAYGNALRLYPTPLYASRSPGRIRFVFMHPSPPEMTLIPHLLGPLLFYSDPHCAGAVIGESISQLA